MSLTSYRAAPPRVIFERPGLWRLTVWSCLARNLCLPVLESAAFCGSAGAALAPRYGLVCGNKKAALTAALYRQSPFIVLRRYRSFASQGRLAVARFRAARPERSDRRSRQRQDKVMLHLADLAATYSPVS